MHQDSNHPSGSVSRRDVLTMAVAGPLAAAAAAAVAEATIPDPKPEPEQEEKRVSAILWPASEECFHSFVDVTGTFSFDDPAISLSRRYRCEHCDAIVVATMYLGWAAPELQRTREARLARSKQIDELIELGNQVWRSRPRD